MALLLGVTRHTYTKYYDAGADANRQRDLAISQDRVAVGLAKQGDTPRAS
jgi:hypothetical protein